MDMKSIVYWIQIYIFFKKYTVIAYPSLVEKIEVTYTTMYQLPFLHLSLFSTRELTIKRDCLRGQHWLKRLKSFCLIINIHNYAEGNTLEGPLNYWIYCMYIFCLILKELFLHLYIFLGEKMLSAPKPTWFNDCNYWKIYSDFLLSLYSLYNLFLINKIY